MTSAAHIAPSCELHPAHGPLFRSSRGALLLLLAVIYAGGIQFFIKVSPALLYGTYVVIIGCLTVCFFFDWRTSRNLKSIAPYLIWTLGYFLWGMLAISHEPVAMSEGVRMYIKNILVIGSLACALDRRTLKPFAQLLQLSVLGNLAICLFEVADPSLVTEIANTREAGATAFDVLRPAGLWSNPDEAASAFLFSLLMTRWAGGKLAWFGGAAAVAGIFLGASRTGALLLTLCGAFYAVHWMRRNRIDSLRLAIIAGALLLVAGAAFLAVSVLGFDPSESWQITRMLDITEKTHGSGDASRVHIAIESIKAALDGPWYGYGLFTFQFHASPDIPTVVDPPAHNIFIAVLGETGMLVGISYLVILGVGFRRVFKATMLAEERLPVMLMWICYLLIGFTWHNQFTSFSGMLYIAILWRLPDVLKISHEPQTTAGSGPVLA